MCLFALFQFVVHLCRYALQNSGSVINAGTQKLVLIKLNPVHNLFNYSGADIFLSKFGRKRIT